MIKIRWVMSKKRKIERLIFLKRSRKRYIGINDKEKMDGIFEKMSVFEIGIEG